MSGLDEHGSSAATKNGDQRRHREENGVQRRHREENGDQRRHREERSDVAIHATDASSGPNGLLAALALRASLRLFDALRALVPRFARNDRIPMVGRCARGASAAGTPAEDPDVYGDCCVSSSDEWGATVAYWAGVGRDPYTNRGSAGAAAVV